MLESHVAARSVYERPAGLRIWQHRPASDPIGAMQVAEQAARKAGACMSVNRCRRRLNVRAVEKSAVEC